jgi:anti-sigma regulatory factor (Ser/Thr protein kinase)
MEQDLWCDEIVLAADVSSARRARSFVTHQLIEHRLPYLVDEVRLVASELATNAVVHAATEFTVVLEGKATSVLLTVSDGSSGALRPLDIAPATAASGRGLHIVNIVSQEWGVGDLEGSSKSVWARFARRPAAAT